MRDDNESLLQKLISGASNLITPRAQIRIQCPDCGVEKLQGDTSPCGSHPVLSDPSDDTFMIRIGFVKPKAKIEGEVVKRSDPMRQLSSQPKDIKRVIEHDPREKEEPTAEQIEAERKAELNRKIREHDPTALTGAPRRKQHDSAEWGMSSKEMNRRMDIAEGLEADREDPDEPTYTLN